VVADEAAEQVFDEITSTLGYVVGKLGKAPEGSKVAFELTGPLQRAVRVAVDGKARVVDEFDGDPTTSILVDAVLFTRLLGGRTTAAQNVDAIEITGDVELGRQVVDRLRFVI
jgi:ubiquinone biosynthesis protein UbiJ